MHTNAHTVRRAALLILTLLQSLMTRPQEL